MKSRDAALVLAIVAIVIAVAWVRSGRGGATAPSAGTGSGVSSAAAAQPGPRVPRMVDLGAGRCIPCKKMAPILAKLQTEYAGRAEVAFIDVWERPELAEGYSFRAIPTQIFYDREGREAWRHEGFLDRPEIVAQFRRLGVE